MTCHDCIHTSVCVVREDIGMALLIRANLFSNVDQIFKSVAAECDQFVDGDVIDAEYEDGGASKQSAAYACEQARPAVRRDLDRVAAQVAAHEHRLRGIRACVRPVTGVDSVEPTDPEEVCSAIIDLGARVSALEHEDGS